MKHLGEIVIALEVIACLVIAVTSCDKEILNEKKTIVEYKIPGGYYTYSDQDNTYMEELK